MSSKSGHIEFTKMVASGNDFVVIENLPGYTTHCYQQLARIICRRMFSVGADGLLVVGASARADISMRIFNADGSEADMCGNGARCVALYEAQKKPKAHIDIQTKAGIVRSVVDGNNVKIKLTDPVGLEFDIALPLARRRIRVNFINTGVPHAVIFVHGLDQIDVKDLGRQIRYHKRFQPAGTNVNFVEVAGDGLIRVRTYERGVEDETLACGTGSVASALIYASKADSRGPVKVSTLSGEKLDVYFTGSQGDFSDVWLKGQARRVFCGTYLGE